VFISPARAVSYPYRIFDGLHTGGSAQQQAVEEGAETRTAGRPAHETGMAEADTYTPPKSHPTMEQWRAVPFLSTDQRWQRGRAARRASRERRTARAAKTTGQARKATGDGSGIEPDIFRSAGNFRVGFTQ
jgi:hypothetical protein